MKLETFNIKELKPAEYNPRKPLTSSSPIYRKIRKSIEELGYSSPIFVNSDMTVISGHHRLTVLKDMGWKEVQCIVLDLDKNREKLLNVALNNITGEWDMEKPSGLLKDVGDM